MFRKSFWIGCFAVVLVVFCLSGSVSSQGLPDQIKFTLYEGNPVLDEGSSFADWDGDSVTSPEVVFYEGLYHMFYTGIAPGRYDGGIGYATSADGFVWQKHPSNPILVANGTGFDAATVSWPAVLVDGDTWVLYFSGQDRIAGTILIGRATALDPSGPWTKDEDPVLLIGQAGTWDHGGVYPISVLSTDAGYRMYYAGGAIWAENQTMIGLATSSDGITWTKYDDPTTTDPAFAESDPVLGTGFDGWETRNIWGGDVRQTEDGWEMFYSERDQPEEKYSINCATSDDGIHWVKCAGNPLVSPEDDPFLVASLFADSVVVSGSTYMLYYDYHWTLGRIGGISVAIGTTSGE
jgi:hypothetical protein